MTNEKVQTPNEKKSSFGIWMFGFQLSFGIRLSFGA
jgi:hypothetical protein